MRASASCKAASSVRLSVNRISRRIHQICVRFIRPPFLNCTKCKEKCDENFWINKKAAQTGRQSFLGYSTLIENYRGGVLQPWLSNYCLSLTPPPLFVGSHSKKERGLLFDCGYSIAHSGVFVNIACCLGVVFFKIFSVIWIALV